MNTHFLKFIFLFFICSNLFSQKGERVENLPVFDKKKFHYGFYLGVNQNDFKIDLRESNFPNAEIFSEPTIGFNVGLIAEWRWHKNLSLRFEPGLLSNTKTIIFNHLPDNERIREVGSTYLHVPVLLKFSTDRIGNVRPYLIGGFSYDYNFSSNEKNQDDNSAGEFRMRTSDFMYEVGVGVDFYLGFFKFSPSIRGVFAINNEIVYDNDPNSRWTSPVDYFGTRGIFLNFAFE